MADAASNRGSKDRFADLSWDVAKNCITALLIYIGGLIGGYIVASPRLLFVILLLALPSVISGFYFGVRTAQASGEQDRG